MYTPEELSTVETENLVETLHRRCHNLIVIMGKEEEDGVSKRQFWVRGPYFGALGLVEAVRMNLLQGELLMHLEDEEDLDER